jgi:cobalt-zinc-cadmium efflux system protein
MQPKNALSIALILSVTILIFELVGGIVFSSTALVADALHVTTDILAISFSLFALAISSRPPMGDSTYGYHRIEVVASFVNGLSLIGIVFLIMYEAYLRIVSPQQINVLGTIAFGGTALVINVVSSRILGNAESAIPLGEDLNVSSAKTHIFGDALASLAVIIGAIGVYLTGLKVLDPVVAIFIGLIVLRGAIRITTQGGAIIMERSPIKNMAELQKRLVGVNGVGDVHDLHAWRICSHITVASIHACLNSDGKLKPMEVRRDLENKLEQSGLQHVTIQLEEVCCVPSHSHKQD